MDAYRIPPVPEDKPRANTRRRLVLVKVAFFLFFAVIGLRLVQIQAVDSSRYQEIARKQYEARVILPATRGNIYDRKGRILVSNAMLVSFGADPKIVGDKDAEIADRFARVFGRPQSYYREKLASETRRFVWLERRVKPELVKRIRPDELTGVIVLNEPLRLYHYDHTASQMVGFTNVDNKGISGIELQFEDQLKGTDGFVIMQRDGLGRRRPAVDYPRVEPVNGNNIVLTIDLEYQAIAEEALRAGMARNKATSGLVVMMDPATGEVLAMANAPGFNPNKVTAADSARTRNRTITDMFEPGSVFKIVTASAALEHGLVKPEDAFYAERGRYTVPLPGGRKRTITDTHEYGTITFREAVAVSSNIVMAKVSDVIGAERFYKMARNFGFGIPTGIELPGEASGTLPRPVQWSLTTLNTMAFGYEVSTTPLQIACAYAALAAGGVLHKPYIVKQITDATGRVVLENQPQVVRRVLSPETAETLKSLFEEVVVSGTGAPARIEHVRVGGKTGTSRKLVSGAYSIGSYTASFVGFLPADDPRLVCLVMLDNPSAGGYTGGTTSAPIFKDIAEKVLATSERFSSRPKPVMASGRPFVLPDVVHMKLEEAVDVLEELDLEVEAKGEGKIVTAQSPPPGTRVAPGSTLVVFADAATRKPGKDLVRVPDLRGCSVRRALTRLTVDELIPDVQGSGVVVSQSPQPGMEVPPGARVSLRCAPRQTPLLSMN